MCYVRTIHYNLLKLFHESLIDFSQEIVLLEYGMSEVLYRLFSLNQLIMEEGMMISVVLNSLIFLTQLTFASLSTSPPSSRSNFSLTEHERVVTLFLLQTLVINFE